MRKPVPAPPARAERGNAMVEFALSFALIFSVFTGVFQFGYAYYVYNNLETAVRAGARYACLRSYDSLTGTPSTAYVASVRNMVVYGNPAGGGTEVVRGLSPANVSVSMTMERNAPARVTVAVTGYRIDAIFKSILLTGKPRVTFPYMGRWAP